MASHNWRRPDHRTDLMALIASVSPVAGNGQILLVAAPDVGRQGGRVRSSFRQSS
jgi:hypothetical protein